MTGGCRPGNRMNSLFSPLLAGNLGSLETGSLETASSRRESTANLTANDVTAQSASVPEPIEIQTSLGAFTRSKTSMSGPVGVGGFEEGEFEGDGPLEKVSAQILVRGADAVQLRAQEIDEAAKPRIVVQRDPLGVHESTRSIQVTEIGRDVFAQCEVIAGGLEATEAIVARSRDEVRGSLRVSCPPQLPHILGARALTSFLGRYPPLRAQLHLSNRRVSLISVR